jgi:hypothetical protein
MRRRCLEPEVERADAAGFDLGRDSIDPFPTSSQVLTYSNRCGLLSSDRPGSMQSGVSYFTLPTLGRPSRPSCSRQGRVAGDGASRAREYRWCFQARHNGAAGSASDRSAVGGLCRTSARSIVA